MKFTHRPILLLAVLCSVFAGGLRAAEAGPDDRMRAMLRDLTVQLRTAQSDLATAQATQTSLTAEKKDLSDKYELIKKQSAADRAAAETKAANLAKQLNELQAQLAKLTVELKTAQGEGEKSAVAARTTEEQRAKLAGELADTQQKLADREAKNLALFLLGNEILTRYQEFSLGTALRAKEPFVGQMRTKLENLVQDYQDKLADQRVKP